MLASQNCLPEGWFIDIDLSEKADRDCYIYIDTVSNPDNIWQIGKLKKPGFDSAYMDSIVLVTDTSQPYPVNDTSSVIIKFSLASMIDHYRTYGPPPYLPGHGYHLYLGFTYKLEADTNDYWKAEISIDSGLSWIPALDSTCGDPLFPPLWTGSSVGWDLHQFLIGEDGSNGKSLSLCAWQDTSIVNEVGLLRFTFYSDSIPDSLGGLMLRDINYTSVFVLDREAGTHGNLPVNSFPQPAHTELNLSFDNPESRPFRLRIIGLRGEILKEWENLKGTELNVDVSSFSNGIYFYELFSEDAGLKGNGKFLIHR